MKKAYLVGSGIASLSAAIYMIRDGGMPGQNIVIFDYEATAGGSLDAAGDPSQGYICRGTRGFEFDTYSYMADLFQSIPSLVQPDKSMDQVNREFAQSVTIDTKVRLMNHGKKVDASRFGLGIKDLLALNKLIITPESMLDMKAISDVVPSGFFTSNFWWMFSTIFAFAPWHSAIEVRRYMLAFFQNVPDMHTLHSIRACPLNNRISIVDPMVAYLKNQGVNFQMQTAVKDVIFTNPSDNKSAVAGLVLDNSGEISNLSVAPTDLVFLTLGSIAAPLQSPSWQLWRRLAQTRPEFGQPGFFTDHPTKSTMTTCTITCNDTEIYDRLHGMFDQDPQINRLTTFIDSPWSVSLVVPKQPWFPDQPKDTRVFWCHGILPEGIGRYVTKRMEDCSGAEILTEIFSLLGLEEIPRLVAKTICRKTVLPMGHAQFLTRSKTTRPQIIPHNAINYALLGQYVETEGTTYTMEYSIRTAAKAVHHYFGLNTALPKIYHGLFHPYHIMRAIKAFLPL